MTCLDHLSRSVLATRSANNIRPFSDELKPFHDEPVTHITSYSHIVLTRRTILLDFQEAFMKRCHKQRTEYKIIKSIQKIILKISSSLDDRNLSFSSEL